MLPTFLLTWPQAFACDEEHLNLDEYAQPGPALFLSKQRQGARCIKTFAYRVGEEVCWSFTPPEYGTAYTFVFFEHSADLTDGLQAPLWRRSQQAIGFHYYQHDGDRLCRTIGVLWQCSGIPQGGKERQWQGSQRAVSCYSRHRCLSNALQCCSLQRRSPRNQRED